jgi:hypothetical protein
MDSLTVASFTKAFIAHLIEVGETAIYPKSPRDRRGFQSVVDTLEREIDRLKSATSVDDRALYRTLVRLRNGLRASNTGAFDALETALRNVQLNFTNCPNPFYEEIAFTVSPPFAKAVLAELPESHRELAVRAADRFLQARQASVDQ